MDKDSIKEIASISSDLSEVALDSILKDGIFKDIPVIGSLISIGNLSKSLFDRILLTKILTFLGELDLKNQDEIDSFKENYFKDKDYQYIGSKILLTIEKADELLKVRWLAKLFRGYIDNKYDRLEFLRLISIINSCYVTDVQRIIVFMEHDKLVSNNPHVESYILEHLFSIGLLSNVGFDGGNARDDDSGGNIYKLNNFGKAILNMIKD